MSASIKILITFLLLMLFSLLFYPFGESSILQFHSSKNSKWKLNTNEAELSIKFDSINGNIEAVLNGNTEGYEIYYTVDGSNPFLNGEKYHSALNLNDLSAIVPTHTLYRTSPHTRSFFTGVFAKQIRAVAVNKEKKRSNREASLIFPSEKSNLPVVNLNLEPEALFSFNNGIYVEGKESAFNGRKGLKWWYWSGNYSLREKNSRDAYVQLNAKNGKCYKVKVKISGNATRAFPQKSLRLDTDDNWDVIFNPEEIPGAHVCNSILLRNAGNDWAKAFIRDPLAQQIVSGLKSLEHQTAQPVQVFVNGEFWGMHYLSLRFNSFYFAEKYRVAEHQVRTIDFADWNESTVRNNAKDLLKLEEVLNNEELSNNVKLDWVHQLIDTETFVDFICSEVFFANYDWPLNNNKAFCVEGQSKWKWLLNDIDVGLGYYGAESEAKQNMFVKLDTMKSLTARIYQCMVKDSEIKKQLRARMLDLLSTTFHPKNTILKLDLLQNQLASSMPSHIQRWRSHQNSTEWKKQCDGIRVFLVQRHQYLQQYLSNEASHI